MSVRPWLRTKAAAIRKRTLSATQQTASHWDQLASEDSFRDLTRKAWGGIHQVHRNHNFLTTGKGDYYWIDYLRDGYFPAGDAGDLLSMGCGEGRIERLFKERGFLFRSVTGFDLSRTCIEKAKQLAADCELAPRVDYQAVDLNRHPLAESAYDFILFFHALHHIEALEDVISRCQKALRPNGLMMVNEFVGPSRFQWTDKQLEMADAILALLPKELRIDLDTGQEKIRNVRHSIEQMIATDPSESVRSAEIEPILKEDFQIVEEKSWGGTLNNLIFEKIAGNFNPDDFYHNAIAELLIHLENIIIQHEILPSDFKLYMLRPYSSG